MTTTKKKKEKKSSRDAWTRERERSESVSFLRCRLGKGRGRYIILRACARARAGKESARRRVLARKNEEKRDLHRIDRTVEMGAVRLRVRAFLLPPRGGERKVIGEFVVVRAEERSGFVS